MRPRSAPVQIRARREHGGAAAVDSPFAVTTALTRPPSVSTADLRLLDAQVRLQLERVLHHGLVFPPVGLRARSSARPALCRG